MKKIFCIMLILIMTVGFKFDSNANEREEIIDEYVKYAEEKLQSIEVPDSPKFDVDFYLWKEVRIESRPATEEEVNGVRECFLDYLRKLLNQREEALKKARDEYQKIVLNGFSYAWEEHSTTLGDNFFIFRYDTEQLDQLFDKLDKEIDENLLQNSLNKTKEEIINELTVNTTTYPEFKQLLQQFDKEVILRNIGYLDKTVEVGFDDELLKDETKRKDFFRKIRFRLLDTKKQVEVENYKNNWESGLLSTWAKETAEEMIQKELVPENLQNKYQDSITREEFSCLFITALLKLYNEDFCSKYYDPDIDKLTPEYLLTKISTTQKFEDTDNKYIKLAYIFGLIEPDENNKFNPNDYITREELATSINSYFQTAFQTFDYDINQILEDADEISENALGDVSRVYELGHFRGVFTQGKISDEKRKFIPKKTVTREEAIYLLSNIDLYMNYLPLRGYLPIELSSLMSGFDIDGNTIKMRKSGYDLKSVEKGLYNRYTYFRKTSYILNYDCERLNSFFIYPHIEKDQMIDEKYLTSVVKGEYTCKDYKAIVVEHNKDGYLTIVTKKPGYGKFVGRNSVFDLKNNEIIDLIKEEKVDTTFVKPALNKEESETYLGSSYSYPQQWTIPHPGEDLDFTDLLPIGTKIGYLLETEVAVTLNGKNVNSYNIGGQIAIELDALKDFGYNYEIIDHSYDEGVINLYLPEEDSLKKFNEKVNVKDSSINGKVLYELIGDQYYIRAYDKPNGEEIGKMRCFTTPTGKRFILVDELWNEKYFYLDKMGLPKIESRRSRGYKVEGNPYSAVSLSNNKLAIVDKTDPKCFKVDLLLKKDYSILKPFVLPTKYPQLIDQILDPYTLQAWYVAEDIVNNSVKPNMSDKEKSDAISEALNNHGYYLKIPLVPDFMGYGYDEAYEALVEKYSNSSGWLDAFKMCYSIAGLDVYPEKGTEAYKYANSSDLLPVKLDGEWHFISYLPRAYYEDEQTN